MGDFPIGDADAMAPVKSPVGLMKAGLPVLIFLLIYFAVTFIVTSLLEELLVNQFSRNNPVLLVIAALLYGALAIALAYYLYRFRKQSVPIKAGGLRQRIALAFTAVALVTSVPQGYLAFRTALANQDVLYNGDILGAVDAGLLVVYDIYADYGERLEAAARASGWRNGEKADSILEKLREVLPETGYLGVYNNNTLESEAGNENLYQPDIPASGLEAGLLPDFGSEDLPSVSWKHDLDGGRYAVISLQLPDSVGRARERLEASYETLLQLKTFRGTFLIVLFLLFLVFAIPLLLLMAMGSLLLSDRITRPLVHLTSALSEVSAGRYDIQLETEGDDEIASLTRSFNAMASELDTTKKRVLLAEKIEAWKDIAQQLAHEIRNPLTPIRLSAERLQRKHKTDPAGASELLDSSMEKILREVDQLEALLVEFHDFARLPPPVKAEIDAAAVVDAALDDLRLEHPSAVWDFSLEPSEGLFADRNQLAKLFGILAANAVEASGTSPRVAVNGQRIVGGADHWYRFSVTDNGRGIPLENRAKIFQPYFTTKPDGTGLGLALVQRIVHEHGGRIWFDCPPEGGTVFTMDFPLKVAK